LLVTFARKLRGQLRKVDVEIAHLKMTLLPNECPGLAAISLTSTEAEPHLTHSLSDLLTQGLLTVNLRAEADPEVLKRQVNEVLGVSS
jgi:hypothetical protein